MPESEALGKGWQGLDEGLQKAWHGGRVSESKVWSVHDMSMLTHWSRLPGFTSRPGRLLLLSAPRGLLDKSLSVINIGWLGAGSLPLLLSVSPTH